MIGLLRSRDPTLRTLGGTPMRRIILFILPIPRCRCCRVQPLVFLSSLELRIIRITRVIIIIIIRARSGPVADWFAIATVVNNSAEKETGDRCAGSEQDAVVFDPAKIYVRIKKADTEYLSTTYFTQRTNETML